MNAFLNDRFGRIRRHELIKDSEKMIKKYVCEHTSHLPAAPAPSLPPQPPPPPAQPQEIECIDLD